MVDGNLDDPAAFLDADRRPRAARVPGRAADPRGRRAVAARGARGPARRRVETDLGTIQARHRPRPRRSIARLEGVLAAGDRTAVYPALASRRSRHRRDPGRPDRDPRRPRRPAARSWSTARASSRSHRRAQAARPAVRGDRRTPSRRTPIASRTTRAQYDELDERASTRSRRRSIPTQAIAVAMRKYVTDGDRDRRRRRSSESQRSSTDARRRRQGGAAIEDELADLRTEIQLGTRPRRRRRRRRSSGRATLRAQLKAAQDAEQRMLAGFVCASRDAASRSSSSSSAIARRGSRRARQHRARRSTSSSTQGSTQAKRMLARSARTSTAYKAELAEYETRVARVGGTVLGASFKNVKAQVLRRDRPHRRRHRRRVVVARRKTRTTISSASTSSRARELKQLHDEFKDILEDTTQKPPAPRQEPTEPPPGSRARPTGEPRQGRRAARTREAGRRPTPKTPAAPTVKPDEGKSPRRRRAGEVKRRDATRRPRARAARCDRDRAAGRPAPARARRSPAPMPGPTSPDPTVPGSAARDARRAEPRRGHAVNTAPLQLDAKELEELKDVEAEYDAFVQAADEHDARMRTIARREYDPRTAELEQRYAERIAKTEADRDQAPRRTRSRCSRSSCSNHPDHEQFTPDAMFRLADLYLDQAERRGRCSGWRRMEAAGPNANPDQAAIVADYSKSLACGSSILTKFPNYRQTPSTLYLLAYYGKTKDERKSLADLPRRWRAPTSTSGTTAAAGPPTREEALKRVEQKTLRDPYADCTAVPRRRDRAGAPRLGARHRRPSLHRRRASSTTRSPRTSRSPTAATTPSCSPSRSTSSRGATTSATSCSTRSSASTRASSSTTRSSRAAAPAAARAARRVDPVHRGRVHRSVGGRDRHRSGQGVRAREDLLQGPRERAARPRRVGRAGQRVRGSPGVGPGGRFVPHRDRPTVGARSRTTRSSTRRSSTCSSPRATSSPPTAAAAELATQATRRAPPGTRPTRRTARRWRTSAGSRSARSTRPTRNTHSAATTAAQGLRGVGEEGPAGQGRLPRDVRARRSSCTARSSRPTPTATTSTSSPSSRARRCTAASATPRRSSQYRWVRDHRDLGTAYYIDAARSVAAVATRPRPQARSRRASSSRSRSRRSPTSRRMPQPWQPQPIPRLYVEAPGRVRQLPEHRRGSRRPRRSRASTPR